MRLQADTEQEARRIGKELGSGSIAKDLIDEIDALREELKAARRQGAESKIALTAIEAALEAWRLRYP